jgi:transketolase
VAEWMVDAQVTPKKFIRVGTPDAFFKKSGEQEFAREQLGLTGHQIAHRIIHTLA